MTEDEIIRRIINNSRSTWSFRHEWHWDWPWHMVDLRDWFYMVSSGEFGGTYLHVRVMGMRSVWIISPLLR